MDLKLRPRKTDLEIEKANILTQFSVKSRDIARRQREYMKLLAARPQTRKTIILQASVRNAIDQLRKDRAVLKAQLWTATGAEHTRRNQQNIEEIRCHIRCQEELSEHIRWLKTGINNMEREINRITRNIYDLNRKTVPEPAHQAHVAKIRKSMQMLENRLEMGMRRECAITAENEQLREELAKIINDRTNFNNIYMKMVQKLNSDKKYLIDLIEYAVAKFDHCIVVFEKLDHLQKRNEREMELQKVENHAIVRVTASEKNELKFHTIKQKERPTADLPEKEYRRRETFRQKYQKKIDLYNNVLDKILNYTRSHNVTAVINKYKQQESMYYSFFNYENEMSYHMTLLTNSVNRLYGEISNLKQDNRNKVQMQVDEIHDLEYKLEERRKQNEETKRTKDNNDARLDRLMQGVQLVLDQCTPNTTSLKLLLGPYDYVNLQSAKKFLEIIEKQVGDMVATTYMVERSNPRLTYADYLIKDIEKICEPVTNIDEIVLTQQCPECAEVDALNIDEGGGGDSVADLIMSTKEVKRKLYDKVTQPEMQYRLHSISQCRLPRSRAISAKKQSIC